MNDFNKLIEARKGRLIDIELSRISNLEHILMYIVKPSILRNTELRNSVIACQDDSFSACIMISMELRKQVRNSSLYKLVSSGDNVSEWFLDCQEYVIGQSVLELLEELTQ